MTGGRWWWAGVALANGIGVLPAWQAGNPLALLFTWGCGYAVAVLLYSKGGRTPDPLPAPPLIEFDRSLRQALAAKRTENARLHAEWDRDARLATPPEKGVVWQRQPRGYEKWPEFGYSRKPHKITDFNN